MRLIIGFFLIGYFCVTLASYPVDEEYLSNEEPRDRRSEYKNNGDSSTYYGSPRRGHSSATNSLGDKRSYSDISSNSDYDSLSPDSDFRQNNERFNDEIKGNGEDNRDNEDVSQLRGLLSNEKPRDKRPEYKNSGDSSTYYGSPRLGQSRATNSFGDNRSDSDISSDSLSSESDFRQNNGRFNDEIRGKSKDNLNNEQMPQDFYPLLPNDFLYSESGIPYFNRPQNYEREGQNYEEGNGENKDVLQLPGQRVQEIYYLPQEETSYPVFVNYPGGRAQRRSSSSSSSGSDSDSESSSSSDSDSSTSEDKFDNGDILELPEKSPREQYYQLLPEYSYPVYNDKQIYALDNYDGISGNDGREYNVKPSYEKDLPDLVKNAYY